MFYLPGTNFASAVAESRRKHDSLFFTLELWADTPSMYYEAGPLTMWLTHGELNMCRKPNIDPALARRMGVGKVFQMPDKGGTRYLFKLWYTPKRGYFADQHSHATADRVERVFSVDESTFLRWIVDPDNNVLTNGFMEAAEA